MRTTYCLDVDMPPPDPPHPQTILNAVSAALEDLVQRDEKLLQYKAHELAHVHRFAVYLERRLRNQLENWSVTIDMDYDRAGEREKGWRGLPPRPDRNPGNCFRPDVIIHHRGDDDKNLLALEWKKNESEAGIDLLQERLACIKARYEYALGVIVNSYRDRVEWCIVEHERNPLVWCVIRCPEVGDGASVADVR